MRRFAVSILALGLLLVAFGVMPVAALTEHCPDHEGNPGKVQSVSPGDLDDVVLPAGTLVCVKASNLATGIVTADGEESLCDILIEAGIIDGSGESCHNVSYYIVYEAEATPVPPTPVPPTPPTAVQFSVEVCPVSGEFPLAVPDGMSAIRFEHPILVALLLTIRIDGQVVSLLDTAGDGTVGDAIVTPGVHTWSISNAADTEVLASGEVDCPECNPTEASPTPAIVPTPDGTPTGEATPPTLVPDTATAPLVQNLLLLVGTLFIALGSMTIINWFDHRRRG